MVRFIKREKKKKQKKCRGQQTDSISLFFFTKDGMCCQTVKTYTSRIVIGPPREVLHRFHVCGVCVQARVFCEWARCECVCVCVFWHLCVHMSQRLRTSQVRLCIFVRVYSERLLLLDTSLDSDPFYWSLMRHVSRPDKWKIHQGRKKKNLLHSMKHNDGFIAQGGPPPELPRALTSKRFLKICNSGLQLPAGVSELWFCLVENM